MTHEEQQYALMRMPQRALVEINNEARRAADFWRRAGETAEMGFVAQAVAIEVTLLCRGALRLIGRVPPRGIPNRF